MLKFTFLSPLLLILGSLRTGSFALELGKREKKGEEGRGGGGGRGRERENEPAGMTFKQHLRPTCQNGC